MGGFAAIAGAGFALWTLLVQSPQYTALREQGQVATANVTDTSTQTRRTNKRSNTSYTITVNFNAKEAKPFVEAGKPKPRDPKDPIANIAFGYIGKVRGSDSAQVGVSREQFERLSRGSSVDVVFLPAATNDAALFEQVRDYSPWPMTSFGALLLAIGGGFMVFGVRKGAFKTPV